MSLPHFIQENFVLIQFLLLGFFLWTVWKVSANLNRSRFRVREADRLSENQTPKIPLDEPIQKNQRSQQHRLSGIRIDGAPHEILGVRKDAIEREIKKAYRSLMKLYHPDKVARPGTLQWKEAEVIAQAINRAKETMLEALKR